MEPPVTTACRIWLPRRDHSLNVSALSRPSSAGTAILICLRLRSRPHHRGDVVARAAHGAEELPPGLCVRHGGWLLSCRGGRVCRRRLRHGVQKTGRLSAKAAPERVEASVCRCEERGPLHVPRAGTRGPKSWAER